MAGADLHMSGTLVTLVDVAIATKFAALPWKFGQGSVISALKASLSRLELSSKTGGIIALLDEVWACPPSFASGSKIRSSPSLRNRVVFVPESGLSLTVGTLGRSRAKTVE
ncbi:hypothetical protein KSP40_PGU014884 [Platanthera guangdongensis]|uniref:Uncharacterized protein n=1 Tax=Platanthera guangdongensis TaxID=2320717 RepID=A0ABR2N3R0_9ASPA